MPINNPINDHGYLKGRADDDHPQYLLANGSRALTGDMAVAAGIKIDGRDISADGVILDSMEAKAIKWALIFGG